MSFVREHKEIKSIKEGKKVRGKQTWWVVRPWNDQTVYWNTADTRYARHLAQVWQWEYVDGSKKQTSEFWDFEFNGQSNSGEYGMVSQRQNKLESNYGTLDTAGGSNTSASSRQRQNGQAPPGQYGQPQHHQQSLTQHGSGPPQGG
ncbi:hypothetical protein MMC10_010910 [Thelotrema lepadinum]|nr:hypothetical protein [Thelotrema lepadinum]